MKRTAKTTTADNAGRWIMAGFALFVTLAITAFAAQADDNLDQGLKVGETIPLDMAADD
jgi:hypothetical protein